jgi:prolyl-tRNA editing enzyme YbaK/EbsC (Cys-tRNA(Pro) deacylase)
MNNELYTSRIRYELLKEKFQQQKMQFEEILHLPYTTSYLPITRPKSFYHFFPTPTDTITQQLADRLKVDVGLVMKCVVFWWYLDNDPHRERHYLMVLACGNHRIDEGLLQLYLPPSAIVTLADASHVFQYLGASAVSKLLPPLGFRRKIPTIIETRVTELKQVYIPCGRNDATWRMTPQTLITMLEKLGVECSVASLLLPDTISSLLIFNPHPDSSDTPLNTDPNSNSNPDPDPDSEHPFPFRYSDPDLH